MLQALMECVGIHGSPLSLAKRDHAVAPELCHVLDASYYRASNRSDISHLSANFNAQLDKQGGYKK